LPCGLIICISETLISRKDETFFVVIRAQLPLLRVQI
jgi:hypothetical protein